MKLVHSKIRPGSCELYRIVRMVCSEWLKFITLADYIMFLGQRILIIKVDRVRISQLCNNLLTTGSSSGKVNKQDFLQVFQGSGIGKIEDKDFLDIYGVFKDHVHNTENILRKNLKQICCNEFSPLCSRLTL